MQILRDSLQRFRDHLEQEGRSAGTVEKYLRDVRQFGLWLHGQELTKELAAAWREHLLQCGYAPVTINSMLSAVNHFLRVMGREECRIRFLRVQRRVFREQARELTRADWRAGKRVWRAAICFKGKRYYLGSYKRFEDAVQARKQAEEELHNSFLREFAGSEGEEC